MRSYQYLIRLIMAERKRDQHGLKRRKRSCVSCMKNTVILKVCLHLFCFIEARRYCCTRVESTFLCLLFACSVPDIVETLLPLLSNSTRTRRHVVTQLVHMGLVDNAKELKKQKYVFLKAYLINVLHSECLCDMFYSLLLKERNKDCSLD